MNFIQLDGKQMDELFLKGNAVYCDAALPPNSNIEHAIKPGEKIVVLLSNGKKYMGQIASFTYEQKNKHVAGKLEIFRYPKK